METYIEAKDLVDNPRFLEQRQVALRDLPLDNIDPPILDLITRLAKLPYCFTLQSCYGHFLYPGQANETNIQPLPLLGYDTPVEYRIAYLALCVDNSPDGQRLLNQLSQLTRIDPAYLQYGSAGWFWDQQVNSYVIQVEPERYKTQDRCIINYPEALHIEQVRNTFYKELSLKIGT